MARKLACLALSVLFVLAAVAGCASTPAAQTTAPAKTDAAAATTAPQSSEPLKLTVRMFYHGEIDKTMAQQQLDFNNNKIANFHREKSGVDVTFMAALADTAQETQKKAMILASNDTPDMMDMSRDEYYKYALQGVLTETTPYLAAMPDYTKLAGESVLNAPLFKGKLYCFPSVLEEQDLNRTHSGGILVRKDILTAQNIATPKTIDDFYVMWKTIKEKTDYIPLTVANDNTMSAIKAAFRVALDYKEVNGKLEYIWVQPEYKSYLTFMNKLYAEKLLDNEYLTVNSTALVEKLMGDKAFSTINGWAFACVSVRDISTKITGAEMAFLPQPSGADGSKALLFNGWPVQRLWVVPVAAKNKDAAAKFMNYMATAESKGVQDYGIESEDYTKNADGTVKQITEQQMNVTWKICYEVMATPDSFKVRLKAKGYDWAYNQALDAQKDAEITTNLLNVLPSDDSFLKLQQQLALKSYIDEETAKFISGARALTEYDNFVKELKDKGLDQQTDALNTWYTASK